MVAQRVSISIVFVFIFKQFFSIISARTIRVWSEFKIWLYGLISLLITGILFLTPFASPGKVEYQGVLDKKKAGLTATLTILYTLILTLPFYLFHVLGYVTTGDAGLMMCTMTACYSVFPFKPLEGEAIFSYHKGLWLTIFVASISLFLCTALKVLPLTIYLLVGIEVTFLFIMLISNLRREIPEN